MTQKQELTIRFQKLNGFDGFNYDVDSLHFFMGNWWIRNNNADYEISYEHRNFKDWKQRICEDIKEAKNPTPKIVYTHPLKYTHELGWH